MIFRPELVRAITAGRKTVTRRPVRGDEPCRYVAGKTYAVQPGRGRPAILRIAITSVEVGVAGDVTFDEARAEGFRTTDDFKAYWVGLHDAAWIRRQVALLDAETDLADADKVATLAERLPVRFDARHASRPVWVIRFQPSREDRPVFLGASSPLAASGKARVVSPKKRRPGRAKLPEPALTDEQAAGYVESAVMGLPNEPEPVIGADLKRITQQAGTTFVHWQTLEATNAELEAQLRSVDDRVQAARRKAQAVDIDVSREVFKVRSAQADGRPADVIERFVQLLERKAYTTTLRRAA